MILFLLACGPKIPAEVHDNAPIQLSNCNKDSYLYARGIGDNDNEARNDAHRQISEQESHKTTH